MAENERPGGWFTMKPIEAKRITDPDRLVSVSVWLDAFGCRNEIRMKDGTPTVLAVSFVGGGGWSLAEIGMWVVRGVDGEFTVHPDPMFRATFDPAPLPLVPLPVADSGEPGDGLAEALASAVNRATNGRVHLDGEEADLALRLMTPAPAPAVPVAEQDPVTAWLADEDGAIIRTIEGVLTGVYMERARKLNLRNPVHWPRYLHSLARRRLISLESHG